MADSLKLTNRDRCRMVCWPCAYFRDASMWSTDCCLRKNEPSLTIPPLVEMGGTWLSQNAINKKFIILRIIALILVFYIAFFSFILSVGAGKTAHYFIYWTQWTNLCGVMLMALKVISSIKVYRYIKNNNNILYETTIGNVDTQSAMWILSVCQKVLLFLTLPSLCMVTAMYWPFVFDGHFSAFVSGLNSVQLHGISNIIHLIDFFISAERLYYKALLYPVIFGTVYTVWTVIFEIFNGVNGEGNPYIYSLYDWSESMMPIAWYFASAFVLTVFLWILTYIKNIILMASGIGKMIENPEHTQMQIRAI